MCSVVFWLSNSSKYDSIHIQSRFIEKVLQDKGIKVDWIFTDCIQFSSLPYVYRTIKRSSRIFLIYASFDPFIILFKCLKPLTLVFHNITPAKFFLYSNPLVSLRSFLGQVQLKYFFNKSLQVITVSHYNESILKKYGYTSIDVCSPVVNKLNMIEQYKKTEKQSIVYVGRIVENKNTVQLLLQMIKVANSLENGLDFYFVGRGHEGRKYLKNFQSIVDSIDKYNKLRLQIFACIDSNKLEKIISESWLYVTMSLHEGFGMPVCEAIAANTPALFIECGGTETALEGEGMVLKKDMEIYWIKVLELLSDHNKLYLLLINQRKHVEKYYINNMEHHIADTYMKKLLAQE